MMLVPLALFLFLVSAGSAANAPDPCAALATCADCEWPCLSAASPKGPRRLAFQKKASAAFFLFLTSASRHLGVALRLVPDGRQRNGALHARLHHWAVLVRQVQVSVAPVHLCRLDSGPHHCRQHFAHSSADSHLLLLLLPSPSPSQPPAWRRRFAQHSIRRARQPRLQDGRASIHVPAAPCAGCRVFAHAQV